jgi:micrococcal nuclease
MFDRFKLAYLVLIPLSAALVVALTHPSSPALAQNNCSSAYPDICIAPPPPDLDCVDISQRNFRVLAPDPHKFDGDKDGIGCEE